MLSLDQSARVRFVRILFTHFRLACLYSRNGGLFSVVFDVPPNPINTIFYSCYRMYIKNIWYPVNAKPSLFFTIKLKNLTSTVWFTKIFKIFWIGKPFLLKKVSKPWCFSPTLQEALKKCASISVTTIIFLPYHSVCNESSNCWNFMESIRLYRNRLKV